MAFYKKEQKNHKIHKFSVDKNIIIMIYFF